MDIKSHFVLLRDFIGPYLTWINQEVMNAYPSSLDHYPPGWIDELSRLSHHELWPVDSRHDFSALKHSQLYKQFISPIIELECIPKATTTWRDFPKKTFHKIKNKKKHEISRLIRSIHDTTKISPCQHIVDLGGGQGHLARILNSELGIPVLSIDQDLELQRQGKSQLHPDQLVTFVHQSFPHGDLSHHFRQSMSIGLHTCGGLAVDHIKHFHHWRGQSMLNFGCCFHKLNLEDINISKEAKKNPLSLNNQALTLSMRSNSHFSFADFELKWHVKLYRYALHLYLYHELEQKEFVGVGDLRAHHYRCPFEEYAESKLNQLGHKNISRLKLKAFYHDPARQLMIERMIMANIIRWQLGRLVELYLILDRALWLEEQNYQVTIKEYFSAQFSPRNIGLCAVRSR